MATSLVRRYRQLIRPGLLSTAVILYVAFLILQRRRERAKPNTTKEPPTAPVTSNWLLHLLIGHAADFKPWNCSLGTLSSQFLFKRFDWYKSVGNGSAVKLKIVYDDVVFLRDLNTVEAMIGKEVNLFRNSDAVRRCWGKLFPKSIVVLRDDAWKKVRKTLSRAIYKIDLPALPASTGKCMDRGLPDLITEDVCEIKVWDTFAKITLDSFINFTFGYPLNAMNRIEESEKLLGILIDLISMIADRMLVDFPILWHLPFGYTPRIFKHRDTLEDYMDEKIDARVKVLNADRQSFIKNAGQTIIDALILAMEETGTLSREEIRPQLVAMLFGGFDTTTSSLSFLFKLLCENTEYQDILYEEIKDLDLQTMSKRELDDLPYLNAIVRESQRMYAVAPLLPRVPNEDVVVNGTLFKKDTDIYVDSYCLCRDPKHWNGAQDLEQFKPERWFGFSPEPGVFSPFGFGARQCLGYRIGYTQLQSILFYLNKRFLFRLTDKPIGVRFNLGFTVDAEAKFRVERRVPSVEN